jgi:hypothetical protein
MIDQDLKQRMLQAINDCQHKTIRISEACTIEAEIYSCEQQLLLLKDLSTTISDEREEYERIIVKKLEKLQELRKFENVNRKEVGLV